MEELTNIIVALDNRDHLEHDFEAVLNLHREINRRFDALIATCLEEIKEGQRHSIEDISAVFDEEIQKRKALGQHPHYKRNNALAIIYGLKKKLRKLHFEIAKSEIRSKAKECDCALRMVHRLKPNMANLVKYGIAYLYHSDDEYIIFECRQCSEKWIEENAGGGGVFLSEWSRWDSNEYTLKHTFKTI